MYEKGNTVGRPAAAAAIQPAIRHCSQYAVEICGVDHEMRLRALNRNYDGSNGFRGFQKRRISSSSAKRRILIYVFGAGILFLHVYAFIHIAMARFCADRIEEILFIQRQSFLFCFFVMICRMTGAATHFNIFLGELLPA